MIHEILFIFSHCQSVFSTIMGKLLDKKVKKQTLQFKSSIFTVKMLFIGLFLLFPAITGDVYSIYGYSSDLLKKNEGEKVNYYYARHLEKLRKSVKPRFIHIIDTKKFANEHTVLGSGVLFTFKSFQARDVSFVSNVDRFEKHKMTRNEKGVWYYILPRKEFDEKIPKREILYKFVVDGLFVQDSTHDNYEDDNAGGIISKFTFTEDMFKPQEGVLVLENDTSSNKKVIFRLYAPKAKFVSLIGSFNNWDSEIDIMQKSESGYFQIEKSLPAGEYTYLLRIDGKTVVDKKSTELKYHPVFEKVGFFKVN
ncbi:MAG: hypothetical protein OEV78_03720 [Spirochaetia bacterium]|nr:hypothetical protein [Spirochaetia bacterium]